MSQESGRRRFFAEEIQPIANLQSAGLVEALATVPRQQFLPPGPWLIRSESDFGGPSRQTPDGDPRHVYHNLSVAIDRSRQLSYPHEAWLDALRPWSIVLPLTCAMAAMGPSVLLFRPFPFCDPAIP